MNILPIHKKRILIQGLGLHGGGVASARFCCEAGAQVTITDLKKKTVLKESIALLKQYPITYILGEHRKEDFQKADIVIKNPGVNPDSPYLRYARWIESDLSLYFRFANPQNEYWAITGTKGKSTTAALLQHVASKTLSSNIYLGGNIGVSPLSFINNAPGTTILELSAFQIGDLRFINGQEGRKKSLFEEALQPNFAHAILTNIFPDHLNYYKNIDDYIYDKAYLFQLQNPSSHAYIESNAEKLVRKHIRAQLHTITHTKNHDAATASSASSHIVIGANHIHVRNKAMQHKIPLQSIHPLPSIPILYAASFCIAVMQQCGVPLDATLSAIKSFPGLPHRMQCIGNFDGIRVYNDNASTILQASSASLSQFAAQNNAVKPLLILGGADKNGDIQLIPTIAEQSSALFLAPGSATDRFIPLLENAPCPVYGPFSSFDQACLEAFHYAKRNSISVILCSPGATSFHEFEHEFQRGDRFIALADAFFNPEKKPV